MLDLFRFIVVVLLASQISLELHAMTPLKSGTSRVVGRYSGQTGFFSQRSSWFRRFSRPSSVVKFRTFSSQEHIKYDNLIDLLIKDDPVKNNKKIASIYNKTSKQFEKNKDYISAIENYKNAIEKQTAFIGNEHLSIANFYLRMADLYAILGKYNEEIKCCKEHLRIREKVLGRDHRFVASALERLAKALGKKKKFQEAISYRLLELEVRETVGQFSEKMKADIYNNIASNYISIQKHKLAHDFIDKALEAAQASKNKMTLARSYKLAARLSLKQGDYQNAVEYGEKVLRLFPKTEGANIELGHCHKIMGDAQVLLGEVGKGTKSLRIASKIFTDTLGGSHIWTQIAKQALRKACKLESSSDSKLASPTQDPDSQDQKSPLLVSEDQLFRKVFGDVRNAHILMHFLNSVLELRGEKRITDINLINTHRPPLSRGSKEIVFDISCVDQNGTIYVVEMQRSFPGSVFEKRVSYYSARALTDQIRRGDGYDKLDNVVFLGLLDFTLIPDDPSCVSNHRICNVKTALPTFDTLSYSFVELPKFRKKLGDLETVRDKWIYFIKNCHDMKKLPRELSLDQIREVFDIFLDYNS